MRRLLGAGLVLGLLAGFAGTAGAQEMCTRLAGFIERSGGVLPPEPLATGIAKLAGSPLALAAPPGLRLESSYAGSLNCQSNRLFRETAAGVREIPLDYGWEGPETRLCGGDYVLLATLDGVPVLVESDVGDGLALAAIEDDALDPACRIGMTLAPVMGLSPDECRGPACDRLAGLAAEIAASPVREHLSKDVVGTPTDPGMPEWVRRGRALAATQPAVWEQLLNTGGYPVWKRNFEARDRTVQLDGIVWLHPLDLDGRLGLLAHGEALVRYFMIEILAVLVPDGEGTALAASFPLEVTRYRVEGMKVELLR